MSIKIFSGDKPRDVEGKINSSFERGEIEIKNISYEHCLSSGPEEAPPRFHYSLSINCELGGPSIPIRAKIFNSRSTDKLEIDIKKHLREETGVLIISGHSLEGVSSGKRVGFHYSEIVFYRKYDPTD